MKSDLNWRLIFLGGLICAVAAVAAPYITLKLGLGIDLSMVREDWAGFHA